MVPFPPVKNSTLQSGPNNWTPPSARLALRDGKWQPAAVSAVSYPASGNDTCFQIEDASYWFQHRNRCLTSLMLQFPPTGTIFDIGGGNGLVAAALQSAGFSVALLEPGPGAVNAVRRGVRNVIQATLADAGFRAHTLPAAGVFDVIEHVSDDHNFLCSIRENLAPGGRLYCTVPAYQALWSEEDNHAGHFRRYDRSSLISVMERAGFDVEFVTYFFSWLVSPVFVFRTLPTALRLKNRQRVGSLSAAQSEHHLPTSVSGLIGRVHAWELDRIVAQRPVPFGTSLLCVARTNRS